MMKKVDGVSEGGRSNRAFFDEMADHILNECVTEEMYIDAYKRIEAYKAAHVTTEKDRAYYINSGAAEILGMATQMYRRRG